MSFFSRATSLLVGCAHRILRSGQGRILERLSPETREKFAEALRLCPEYVFFLWRVADRLSRLDAEWSAELRRAPGLAILEIRVFDPQGEHLRRPSFSLRRLLATAETSAPADGVFLYRICLSQKRAGMGVKSPRRRVG